MSDIENTTDAEIDDLFGDDDQSTEAAPAAETSYDPEAATAEIDRLRAFKDQYAQHGSRKAAEAKYETEASQELARLEGELKTARPGTRDELMDKASTLRRELELFRSRLPFNGLDDSALADTITEYTGTEEVGGKVLQLQAELQTLRKQHPETVVGPDFRERPHPEIEAAVVRLNDARGDLIGLRGEMNTRRVMQAREEWVVNQVSKAVEQQKAIEDQQLQARLQEAIRAGETELSQTIGYILSQPVSRRKWYGPLVQETESKVRERLGSKKAREDWWTGQHPKYGGYTAPLG